MTRAGERSARRASGSAAALRRAAAAVLGAALVVSLGACVPSFGGPTRSTTSTPVVEQVEAALEPFYTQSIVWKDCGGGAQCAAADVPLDWDDPAGETASIALVRHLATSGRPLGSLLVNPGGPGASGVDFVRTGVDYAVDERLRENFDIVGFDPRGVGASSAVSCYGPAKMDDYLYGIASGVRGSDEWLANQRDASQEFADACLQRTGDLLANVDTVSAARDLDVLRAALGDSSLNYLGYSYGTFLGATYAGLFPEKVGRLVLDGALDPATSNFEVVTEQAKGFESALRAYLADCLTGSECPFTGTVDDAMAQVRDELDRVDASPIRAEDGRELGASTLFTGIIYPLYSQDSWPILTAMFAALQKGDVDPAFQNADSYNGRGVDGEYLDNSTEAFMAINCLDYPYTSDVAVMREQAAELEREAPFIGAYMAYGDVSCDVWPTSFEGVREPITAEGAAPILVVGTSNDPATPYVWAEALADQLSSGHLVSYDGEGHTAYNKSNACVNDAVDDYFIDGTVPETDPRC